MKKWMLLLFLFAGCTGTKEIITKTDTLYVPYAIDTSMTLVRVDTLWTAGNDRIIVKVDTAWKKVYLKIRDTVSVIHTDTVQNIIYKLVDPTEWYLFWHSFKYWISTLLLGALFAGGVILYLIKKFKG